MIAAKLIFIDSHIWAKQCIELRQNCRVENDFKIISLAKLPFTASNTV